ncbi:MAG: hypothetical protein MR809_02000 [Rikenellaceae bacterium]|nr:hypothetical protein [Rikenellaceae bacterium]
MNSVLKVKVAGQRIRYQVSKVTFSDDDLLKANAWRWDDKKKSLYPNDSKLDIIRDYETFDCEDIGVAIRTNGDIYYELGDKKGKIMKKDANVLSALTHPILNAIEDANDGDGLTLVSADVFDNENTIYEYIIEVGDRDTFDEALLEIITINDPITNEEYIVDVRYDGRKMIGGTDGLSFREPASDTPMFMLNVPKDYADALGLGENRKLDNLLRFEDFIKEENQKNRKKPFNKVKSVKDYVNVREDYIHSFIDEHERGVEPEEEE